MTLALSLASLAVASCGGDSEDGAEGDARTGESSPPSAVESSPPSVSENSAPSIAGTPRTQVTEGDAYVFEPSASDADGDALSFAVENKPGWASFDAATGRLTGTPASGDVGVYEGIVIAASDGATSSRLAAFSIEVLARGAGTGTATLSWMAPTERSDGTSLSNLAGYKVHYGNEPRNYTKTIVIDNPGVTTYVVDSLAAGNWYFAASAFDTNGLESVYSNEVFKSVQ